MNKAHACISKSPSGSYRPSMGYAPVGSVCRHCGVTIKKEHVLPKAIDPTEPPSVSGSRTQS